MRSRASLSTFIDEGRGQSLTLAQAAPPVHLAGQSDLLLNIQAGVAQQVRNRVVIQAGGVVFHANGVRCFVKGEFADAVYLARVGDGPHLVFPGLQSVPEHRVHSSHLLPLGATSIRTTNITEATRNILRTCFAYI